MAAKVSAINDIFSNLPSNSPEPFCPHHISVFSFSAIKVFAVE